MKSSRKIILEREKFLKQITFFFNLLKGIIQEINSPTFIQQRSQSK
jgi:hypothetical protein